MNSVAADLALLKTPGELGADIAVGEAQSLGVPMSFGGPYIGYLCCTESLCAKCQDVLSEKHVTAEDNALLYLHYKQENSIYAAKRQHQTFVQIKV